MPGAGLPVMSVGPARPDRLALKPYWGNPAVRNFREGDGNVGIIRSPVRAIALPDLLCSMLLRQPRDAAGDGPHLARGCEPDGPGRDGAAADSDPEGQRVAAGGVVERARHPGPSGPARDGRQHQAAEDGAVVAALEDLGRYGADD